MIAPFLLCQPRIGNAQNPIKEAARAAKVSPDLLAVQTNNGAPTPLPVRGLQVQNLAILTGNTVAIEAVSIEENSQALLESLRRLGLLNGVSVKRMVSGYLPIDKIDELKEVPGLKFARPAYQPQHNAGSVTSQGDKAMRADVARQTYGVTGVGSKIGIISDSYDKLGGAAAGVRSGDLPSGVEVLLDYLQPDASDEGRAMAELVHDVAPGAAIAFHTAQGGQAVFAKAIRDLAAAGCNIIVDDIIYFAEPFFQDGIVAQAADEVVTMHNATFFSAAGNQARSSYQAGFKDSGINIPNYGQAHDFGGGDIRQRITLPAGGTIRLAFQWDDSFFSASGVGARSDLDVLVYSTEGALINGSFGDNMLGDPFEIISLSNSSNGPISVDIVIVKFAGPDPGLVKWINFGSQNIAIEYDTKSSTSYGHANASRAISVAAAPYFYTKAFNGNLETAIVEDFSSAGGTPTLFTTTGERINGAVGITRQKPDITSVDGGNTTFFYPGQDAESDGFPNFFGTSAAAPHAAAVAALMQQKATNGLAPSSIATALKTTAMDMDDPLTPDFDSGFDYRTGYGFIQADRAIQATIQPLALVQPMYTCATGQLTFQTTGGDGSPVEYRSVGITDWTLQPVQFIDAPVRADKNSTTVYLQARQHGFEATTYAFNFRAYCEGSNGNQPPILDNPIGTQLAQRDTYFAFQLPGNTFSDPDNDPLTYSATGLPTGLTFDAVNRRIEGIPTQAGTFPITITAVDAGGLSAQVMFTLLVSPTGSTQPLALIAPLYDCSTGAITFRTVEGDGTPITYTAIGVQRNAPTEASGMVEAELRGDPKPIVISATQSGVTVSYTFDFAAFCRGEGAPTPPVTGTLALLAPTYDCASGQFSFQVTGVKAGKTVEYYSVPGITDWSVNPTHQFNNDLRTAGDVKPFTLRARYTGEPGSEVTLEWIRPLPCLPNARLATEEIHRGLQVMVLGNPARDEQVEINVLGATGKSLQVRVSNSRGEPISEQTVETTGTALRRYISLGRSPGIYLLQVNDGAAHRTVKIVRQ